MSLPQRFLATRRRGGRYHGSSGSGAISGPYDPAFTPGATVLTQLHCHTNQSDGSYTPATVVSSYLAAGYGALQITDHDKVTTQPAGITTAISGNELSPTDQHIIGINTTYTRGATTAAQAIIDGILTNGGQAQIAHPKWYRGMTYAEMEVLTGHLGLEIHNAKCVNGAGQNPVTYPGFAVDVWDQLLTGSGRRDLWAFATDDLHKIDVWNAIDVGRVHVFAATNTVSDVVDSLVSGDFVADVSNHGVTPGYPERDETGISLTCSGATSIEAVGAGGVLLGAAAGDSLTWTWTGLEQYVRMVAVGDYTEPFSSALSSQWMAAEGTWAVAGGVLALSADGLAKRLILRRHREANFSLQVDIKLSSVSSDDSAAVMFNVLNGSYYYIVKIGPSTSATYDDKLAIGYTTSNNFGGGPALAYTPFVATPGTWYTLKMQYTTPSGLIEAKVWERGTAEPGSWMVTATDNHWRTGAFGLRANRSCEYDNLYIDGFRTYYQPLAVEAA